MNDVKFAARDRRLEALFMKGPCAKVERVLVARPNGFFSLRHSVVVEEQDEHGRSVHGTPANSTAVVHAACILLFVGASAFIGWLGS